jgi:hypothetical protein
MHISNKTMMTVLPVNIQLFQASRFLSKGLHIGVPAENTKVMTTMTMRN